jgi:predicted RNA-binding Zn ribbon-like protein
VSDDDALHRALRLREALYRCALGRAAPADWHLLAREAAAARGASALVPGPDGVARWVPGADGDRPAGIALHAAAAAAEHLVTSALVTCVSACPGAGCGWLFADQRRRRRWCSMAVCGNRAKARRHAERRQETASYDTPYDKVRSAKYNG